MLFQLNKPLNGQDPNANHAYFLSGFLVRSEEFSEDSFVFNFVDFLSSCKKINTAKLMKPLTGHS